MNNKDREMEEAEQYIKAFNEKHEQKLIPLHEIINKKFDTNVGKRIVNWLVYASGLYLDENSQVKLLTCLITRDLEKFCETRKIESIKDFEPKIILYTQLCSMDISGIYGEIF